MGFLTRWMDRTLYPHHAHRWDDTQFRERIVASLTPDTRLLDLGAGRGGKTQMNFRGMAQWVAGTDVDAAVLTNPYLDEAQVMQLPEARIPYPDNHFDGIVCNSVVEHVSDIDTFFREVHRVLKPGGWLWAKTPNSRHYVATIARWTPDWFHRFWNGLRGTQARDLFSTTYACNQPEAVRQAAQRHGFDVATLDVIEGRPEYLRVAAPLYLCGFLYERIVNRWEFLARYRCVMMAKLVKRPRNGP